ncbi:hypothetical protein C8Q79DRAFT_999029 [Trametes meyenii]|nr:hypothetical protein C8Q79DRAFT_999029 [Trametes meyenii]
MPASAPIAACESLADPQRPRILLRELRMRKHQQQQQRPRRWDSVPCLKLAPANRPFFVCQGCQFPNVLCEVCPWCLDECDEVAALAAVVRRRLSSPTLLSDAQKMQLARIERRLGGEGGDGWRGTTSEGEAEGRGPSKGEGRAQAVDDLREGVCRGDCAPEPAPESEPEPECGQESAESVRLRHRNAVLYSAADVVATATVVRPLPSFSPPLFCRQLTTYNEEPSPSSPHPAQRLPRRPCAPVQLTDQSEPRTPLSVPPSPLPHGTPSLRRKRRMSVLRQRSSCSLRRRATTSSTTTTHRRSETVPSPCVGSRPKANSVRFSSPPPISDPDAIPLGHPQRPLYTAIRKNMSRPASPSPSLGGSVDAFQTAVYERGTRSLDIPRYNSLGRSYLSIAAYARPVLFPPSASGFSVSGETELRMDLARSRSMDGVPSDFAFREVKADASTVKAKVKSLGKTLKGLLRGRMPQGGMSERGRA